MKIYILRHGQAESFNANDSERRLTDKGISNTKQMIQNCQSLLSSVRTVYASPFIRAQQTANIVCSLLNNPVLQTTTYLEPETSIEDALEFLQSISEEEILLISHLPLVAILANKLCGFHPMRIQFETSSLVGIQCEFPALGTGELLLEKHLESEG